MRKRYYWRSNSLVLIIFFIFIGISFAQDNQAIVSDIVNTTKKIIPKQKAEVESDYIQSGVIYYAFSDSMNPDTIRKNIDIMNEKKIKTVFVLRGLIGKSIEETSKRIQQILQGRKAYFFIDPRVYHQFNIKSVPYLILKEGTNTYTANGDITVDYFLYKIKELGRRDLGKLGQTYEIAEIDMIDEIKRRIAKVNIEEQIREAYKRYINNMPRYDLPKYDKPEEYKISPEIVLKSPIRDQDGNIILDAGQKFNAFDYTAFTRIGVVFDGSDIKQVEYIKKYLKENEDKLDKIDLIVFNTNPIEMSKQLNKKCYYLQQSMIDRFKITNSPVIISAKDRAYNVKGVKID